MNNDSQRLSYELGRIPCPLCRYNMRLKLSLRLLMTQYNDLCEQCKDKMSYIEDKRCICSEKTRAPVNQEKNELYRRIKNFYKSIVPSPKLVHKTKILPFLDEYNPFKSLSVPNLSEYDTKSRQIKLADSEPNLSLGRPSDDRSFRKYDHTDIKESLQKGHLKYKITDEDRKKSDRDYGLSRESDYGPTRERDYGPSRERDYGPSRERDYDPTRERDYGPTRERDYGPSRERDYGPTRERDYGPTRERDYGPTRESDYGPSRERDYGPSRERDYGPTKDRVYGSTKDRDYGPTKDREHGQSRDREYGPSRGREHGATRDRDYGPSREDREVGLSRDREYGPSKDREHGPSKGRDYRSSRDYDAKMVESAPGGRLQLAGKTMHETYDKANIEGRKTTTKEITSSEARATEATGKGMDKAKAKTDRESDETKVKKGKYGEEVQATKGKFGGKETNKNEGKVTKGVNADKDKNIPESKTKRGKDTSEKVVYAERGKGVFEAKEKPDRYGEKVKNADKGKGDSDGKEKKDKDVDKSRIGGKQEDIAKGKVKKTKDSSKEMTADHEKKFAEGKMKKGKEGDKEKYANKEKGITEGKAKKGKDGDKGKVNKEPSGDKEKEENEGKEKKGKVKAEKYDHKDKDGDEEKGKKLQHNEKEIERSNKIELDVLSFGERRQLNKKTGEAHIKKGAHKEKKGKDKDGDKKIDELKKKPKGEPSDDEHEPGKEKSKLKKKDAEIDDDMATPLTYTENTSRQPVNPYLVKREKKPKRRVSRKSISKKSVRSIEKIMRPAVKPKILELIKKLSKSPRVIDKYFDRQSSRISRKLLFDESYRLNESEKSFLELLNTPSIRKIHKVIVGNRVIKYKPPIHKSSESEDISIAVKPRVYVKYEEKPALLANDTMKTSVDTNSNDLGVLCYALSDRSFISKGYTILPTEKIMRKLNVYRMRPSNPNNNWFARNRRKKTINYTSGQKLAVFEGDERCRIYYKNGNVALDYYQAEDNQAQERIVLYSDGENELKQKVPVPVTVLATFDHMGTGVIFDNKGNVRAKYNQNEGVVLDKTLGPYTKWKWHKLNDPPVLEEIMVDTVLPNKDPRILRMPSKEQLPRVVDEQLLEIEFQNSLKEKGKKIFKSFKPFPVKMKAFKINDQFSLHIMDQSKIYLSFRDGSTSFRIDVGMILDCNEIIDMETSEMGEVVVPIEQKPAKTSSMQNLQRSVEQAKQQERKRLKRSQRQRPLVEPCQSLDRMHSAISRPLRKQIQGHPSDSLLSCPCRKNYNLNKDNYVTYDDNN